MEIPAASTVVILHLEDSPRHEFDLTRLAGPQRMREEVGASVLAWSADEHGIRRTASLHSVRRSMSAWLRWVASWNESNVDVLSSHHDVSAFHIARYREHLTSQHTKETARGYMLDLRSAFRRMEGISQTTFRATHQTVPRAIEAPIARYPESDFKTIRNAARRVIELAHARIHPMHLEVTDALEQNGPRTVRQQALIEILNQGAPETREGHQALGTIGEHAVKGNVSAARRLLFLEPDEAFAAAVLLACHRGLNLSSVVNAQGVSLQGSDFWQLNMDKPRRGSKRFWPEFIDGVTDPRAARALQMIFECTEPARMHLDAQGTPSNALVLRWAFGGVKEGVPQVKTRAKSSWVPSGLAIDFGRLRRSVPNTGVMKEPTDHDPATYLHYVRSDPIAVEHHQRLAAQAIQTAMDVARTKLGVALRRDKDLDAANDALVVNCADPLHNPATGAPCTSAFFSFLDCLDCGNAATVARLLPRQLAAVEVLEQLRDALGDVWERRFARHYYQLQAMLDRHSSSELDSAAAMREQHIPAILAALRHEVPA